MHKNRSQGFTLIELLVVIAIIGILSAVVLASLNTARSKGNDAAIQSDLATVQTQAEIYYGNNTNAYGSNGSLVTSCIIANPTMFTGDTNIKNAIKGAEDANSANNVVCNMATNGTAYAVSSPLVSTTNKYWCVDSTGFAGQRDNALASATACPSS
jgi:type IV pilus assembly protein PilA